MRSCPALVVLIFMGALLLACGCTRPAPSPENTGPVPFVAAAESPSTSLAIREYVENAVLYAQQRGRVVAIAAFNNRTGPFVNGDVYVYALDYDGNALALPFQPDRVGTSFLNLTDADGKPYTAIEIQLVKNGGGYLLYRYPRPGNGAEGRLKISYVAPVDDTYWIGAGIYTSGERLVDPGLRAFIDEAKMFARERGRGSAVAEFNNRNGSFTRGDLYVFAYDYNGTVLAWPYRPDQLGVNRRNETDPAGSHHIEAMIAAARNGSGMVDYYSVNPRTNRTDLKISYITDVDGTWFIGAGRYVEPGNVTLSE